MNTDDLRVEVNGDEDLGGVVARYAEVREALHDLLLADLPNALNSSLEGIDDDGPVDSTELGWLFSQVTDLLGEREELLDRLHTAGINIANARIAAGG